MAAFTQPLLATALRCRVIGHRGAAAVCPENITITDNAIIPLKERVVDEYFDPIGRLVKIFSRRKQER